LKKERKRVEDEYKPALMGGTMKKSKMSPEKVLESKRLRD